MVAEPIQVGIEMNNWNRFLSLFLPMRVGTIDQFKVSSREQGYIEIEFEITLPSSTQREITGELIAEPLMCERHGEQPGRVVIAGFPECLICMKDSVGKEGTWP